MAPKFRKDILLVVGSKDKRTPQWMSEKIYEGLPDGIRKKLSVYEGAGAVVWSSRSLLIGKDGLKKQ